MVFCDFIFVVTGGEKRKKGKKKKKKKKNKNKKKTKKKKKKKKKKIKNKLIKFFCLSFTKSHHSIGREYADGEVFVRQNFGAV